MSAAVEVRDAFRLYEGSANAAVALQGLDLTVADGEIVVVLGPSGSGKTTLLRVLAGLERLSAGSANVLGIELGRLSRARAAAFRAAHLGLLDQHYARALSPDLSCRHTVALQLELAGAAPPASRAVADGLLDRVGLLDRADDRPATLSGGEQQRVAVCAAVAHRPGLLLADEPAGELDEANARLVYDLLAELVRAGGATAVIVSHDDAAATIADRLVHLRDGRIVAEGRPGEDPRIVVSRTGWARIPYRGAVPLQAELTLEDDRVVLDLQRSGSEATVVASAGAPAADAGAGETVARVERVSKRFPTPRGDRTVLDCVSHEFRAGVLTGVVGRSGSGKTTLLHLIAGLERASEGAVTVAGQELSSLDRRALAELRRREIALVTQEPGLIPYLTAQENVELALDIRRAPDASARALEALERVGLAQRTGHPAATLSAGERQRVAIARALAARPRILLLDEPTARLDEENTREMGRLLAGMARETGLAVICATHDPILIERMDETLRLGSSGTPSRPLALPDAAP